MTDEAFSKFLPKPPARKSLRLTSADVLQLTRKGPALEPVLAARIGERAAAAIQLLDEIKTFLRAVRVELKNLVAADTIEGAHHGH